jgi:hypothetical protein
MDSLRLNHWTHGSETDSLEEVKNLLPKSGEITMATTVLNRLTEIRDSYLNRRALWRDLSAYTSPGELNDIEAALARSEADGNSGSLEIRRFLAVKRAGLNA